MFSFNFLILYRFPYAWRRILLFGCHCINIAYDLQHSCNALEENMFWKIVNAKVLFYTEHHIENRLRLPLPDKSILQDVLNHTFVKWFTKAFYEEKLMTCRFTRQDLEKNP